MIPPSAQSSRDIYSTSPPSLDLGVFLRRMRSAQRSHQAPSCDARVAHLDRLEEALLRRKGALVDAIQKDFGNRSRHETLIADIFVTLNELKFARAHLRAWMQLLVPPEHVVLVQAAPQLGANPLQALLVGQLKAQLLRGVLGGFGLELPSSGNPGYVAQVHKGAVVRAKLEAHLAHRFKEW